MDTFRTAHLQDASRAISEFVVGLRDLIEAASMPSQSAVDTLYKRATAAFGRTSEAALRQQRIDALTERLGESDDGCRRNWTLVRLQTR